MYPRKILFTGMPGSGKGTQAKLLLQKYALPYLSTGEMFRQEMANQTPLGEKITHLMNTGQYVDDETTNEVVTPYLKQDAYLLDGYPRTLNQVHHLEQINPPDLVILLEVDEELVVKRILDRGKTSGRSEDASAETIRTRINLYYETMKPVIIHYSGQHKINVIRADGSVDDVQQDIRNLIEGYSAS